ncbi:hypothetical protein B0A48_02788 [Cryoendolithus antarcticus]|uniref:Ribosome biogenesis protein ERB1 n=1 Tax=Cryoendolithus antarcticus TaxID=1507870 RepID=A0A1V8TLQ1_9PEZI|nr:hypothetical protein B0A48_02788 [Cryoendolithus antarcticus]
MAQQRAGQKRKVVEIPLAEQVEDDVLGNGDFDEELAEDEGSDGDEEFDEDEEEDGDEEDSDEEPLSEDGEDVRQQLRDLKTSSSVEIVDPDKDPDTDLATNGTYTPEKRPADLSNYDISVDANGNPRYIYKDIEPNYDTDDSDAPITKNTIGNIPLSYYDAYPHIGYDVNGRCIQRPAKGAALDSLLDSIDIPAGWTGLTDPATGKPLNLSREELEVLKKLSRNETPGDGYDPYPDMVEYFTGKGMEEVMPLSAAPEPKRRFVPSMHEHKRVMKIVKAIKEGRIKPYKEPTAEDLEKEEQEQEYAQYDVWANEVPRPDHAMNMPAPKLPPPGYEESYHPPPEYLPDKHQQEEWEKQDEEDRTRDFLPKDHSALRKVPGYAKFVKEKFERCLDLYLAPRVRRSKLNIDPESLLPKLPDPAELRPFPDHRSVEYVGHKGRVRTIAIDPTGDYLASGGDDGTVRIWELSTGHLKQKVRLSTTDPVNIVAWRPVISPPILAACCADNVHFIVPTDSTSPTAQAEAHTLLTAGFSAAPTIPTKSATGVDKPSPSSWHTPIPAHASQSISLTLSLRSTPKTLTWHRRGTYFATVCPSSGSPSTAIAIHALPTHTSQHPFKRLKGLPQTALFHPSQPKFFLATRQRVRIYDLQAGKLVRELLPGARWISSLSLHPGGNNLLIGSYDRKLLWHDLELAPTPYKTLRYHTRAIRDVAFHPTLQLFADASDDGSVQIFHGKVVEDGFENATIVPLKVLKGHRVRGELGVLGVVWHPREARCVSAGADGVVRMWA